MVADSIYEPWRKGVVSIVYRPLGGETREVWARLPLEKAEDLHRLLTEPERFVVLEVRLQEDEDGWKMTRTARPEARA